uniref:Uncharacterized protein n=1 Tax=Vitrella brassicaformis TaxID=1169539 RepID=A0A7S1JKS0_9ALVE|mmetsp:Transcript_13279/g.31673  ORF Transcript_13279/g.31673 Transcript_13279/m.31673 type:complete len:349 (+) Transcript_13279:64-1110(+)
MDTESESHISSGLETDSGDSGHDFFVPPAKLRQRRAAKPVTTEEEKRPGEVVIDLQHLLASLQEEDEGELEGLTDAQKERKWAKRREIGVVREYDVSLTSPAGEAASLLSAGQKEWACLEFCLAVEQGALSSRRLVAQCIETAREQSEDCNINVALTQRRFITLDCYRKIEVRLLPEILAETLTILSKEAEQAAPIAGHQATAEERQYFGILSKGRTVVFAVRKAGRVFTMHLLDPNIEQKRGPAIIVFTDPEKLRGYVEVIYSKDPLVRMMRDARYRCWIIRSRTMYVRPPNRPNFTSRHRVHEEAGIGTAQDQLGGPHCRQLGKHNAPSSQSTRSLVGAVQTLSIL